MTALPCRLGASRWPSRSIGHNNPYGYCVVRENDRASAGCLDIRPSPSPHAEHPISRQNPVDRYRRQPHGLDLRRRLKSLNSSPPSILDLVRTGAQNWIICIYG